MPTQQTAASASTPPAQTLSPQNASVSHDSHPSVPSVITPFHLAKKSKLPDAKIHRITGKVCQYIVKSLRPYNTVEDPYFREMLHELNPGYRLPNREDVSERLIPAMYEVALRTLKMDLDATQTVSLTADGWTSRVADHYLTITVHYLKHWELQAKVLQTVKAQVTQTGENISSEIEQCLKDFNLTGKTHVMTTDNARSMINATKMAGMSIALGCFAHTLNLAAQKVLNVRSVCNLLAIVRPVITYFRKSYMAKIVLQEKQNALNIPLHSLILDCKTRWNSTYLMINRFVEQYPAIVASALDDRLKKRDDFKKLNRIDDDHMTRMETFVGVMSLLYKITTAMCSEKRPTAGLILPMLAKLQEHLQDQPEDSCFGSELKKAVWKDLEKRYNDQEEKYFLEEATALDPRFKTYIMNEDAWYRIYEKLNNQEEAGNEQRVSDDGVQQLPLTGTELPDSQQEFKELENDGNCDLEMVRDSKPTTVVTYQSKLSGLGEIFIEDDNNIQTTVPETPLPVAVRAQTEIAKYKSMNKIKTTDDPLAFWKQQSEKLPLLAKIAQYYLVVQATSVASERVFSTAGDIINAERSCLDSENANILIFLKKNLE